MDQRLLELQKQLQDANLRAEEEKRRADEEKRRAEEAKRSAEKAKEQTRPTTLDEYIKACHRLVFSRLTVEMNPYLRSKGSITNPRDKLCPTNLKPWPDFFEGQRQALGTVFSAYPPQSRVFESRSFLAGLGGRVAQRPVADEKHLENFLHNAVGDPVRSIVEQIKTSQEIRRSFGIGDGIVFENHPHALSDISDEVAQQLAPSSPSPPRTPSQDNSQIRPDQICIYLSETMQRIMIFVCEYKAPHKLTAAHLRLGLQPMNIYKNVVNRKTIPTSADPEGLFRYRAERLTAAAVTQTYHYMISAGLEYGLLTNGEAIVFLKVDWEEPETLYYHLAEPGPEALAHPDEINSCATIGQYLAFSLLALGPPGQRREHGQEERRETMQRVKRWAEDFESTLRSIPTDERSPPPGSSANEPITYLGVDRSPYIRRLNRRRLFAQSHSNEGSPRRDPTDSSDDDYAPSSVPTTPSPVERRQGATRRSERVRAQQQRGGTQGRQYCTQKCLLGLVKGSELDQECPNVASHRGKKASAYHPVSHSRWLQLLYEQLERSLDDGIRKLDVGGARGVLFQVTLIAYGYTFVSKGTVSAFVKYLRHEATVYERLRQIQGVIIPVFLGSIDLRDMQKVYYYDHRVYIIHLTFLSWGGHTVNKISAIEGAKVPLAAEVERPLRSIHGQGVIHGDVRKANVLVDPRTQSVMIIDFERASLLQRPRHPLTSLALNKRARVAEPGSKSGMDRLARPAVGSFQLDIMALRGEFPARRE